MIKWWPVIAMSYSVAKDYIQHNIRCNCISPARVATRLFVGRLPAEYYPGHEKEMYEKLASSPTAGKNGLTGRSGFVSALSLL